MSRRTGSYQPIGRLTVVQFGKSHGLTQNLVRFWQLVLLTELQLFGKKSVSVWILNYKLMICFNVVPYLWFRLWANNVFHFSLVTVGETPPQGERGLKTWIRRTNLVDSRTSVTDVKFGPKSLGLQLATCSNDGVIRIYEAPDVMNLSQWTLQFEIQCKLPCSCLTWNHSFSRLAEWWALALTTHLFIYLVSIN